MGRRRWGLDVATGWRYNPSTDTWAPTSMTNAPEAREFHSAVWTGSEIIVLGGKRFDFAGDQLFNTGGRYNPSTDSWTATSTANAPPANHAHGRVDRRRNDRLGRGLLPVHLHLFQYRRQIQSSTDSWTATSIINAPTARDYHTAVWTGNEMIVWGGTSQSGVTNTGGRYNPSTDNWTATSITNAPTARYAHTAVWSGSAMIVWADP